jgi:hypothetical protein
MMTMNIQAKTIEFDIEAARKSLRNAIEIKRACNRDIDTVSITLQDAERRVAKLREGLSEFTNLAMQIAESASEALKGDGPLLPPAGLADVKARHQHLLEEIQYAEAGIASLRAKREAFVHDLGLHTQRVSEAAAPITLAEGEALAQDALAKEHEAALARERVRAFSQSSANQKLGPLALRLMRDAPENASPPMLNTANWRCCQQWKQDFKNWRAALDVDAGAKLVLTGDEQE